MQDSNNYSLTAISLINQAPGKDSDFMDLRIVDFRNNPPARGKLSQSF